MKNKLQTPRDIIDLWPTRKDLFADLSADGSLKVTLDMVNWWYRANSISSKYLDSVVSSGLARGFKIDAETVLKAHRGAA